tara:strand:- start:927 stop:1448 length:522 start_codon:yes stop_codon:yes gene_type:complete
MTLQQKLAHIQTELKAKKSRFNSFGKYYFRSAEDILESIKPFLLKYNITVTVDEKFVGTDVPDGIPVLKSTATLHDEKGMTLSTSAIVGVDLMQKGMQTPQQFGSASSYGKKYALGNLFLIDDTQDSDATNTHKQNLSDMNKAKDYIKSGGKLDAIKKKYQLTPSQEKELTTL